MEWAAARETTQIAQFGHDQRSSNRADARDSFNRVSHGAKEPLDVKIKLGQLLFEELQLSDHRVDQQIQSRIPAPGRQVFCSRFFERLGFGDTESATAGARYESLQPAQRKPGNCSGIGSGFEQRMGRFAVEIVKVPTEFRKAQIDQASQPSLGVGQFMSNETPLSTKQLKLLGLLLTWLEWDEIAVPHGAGDEKRIVGIGLAAPQMRACVLVTQNRIENLDSPIALQQKAPQAHPIVAAGFQADQQRAFVTQLRKTLFKGRKTFRTGKHFYGLEQHLASGINGRRAVEAFSNVDTDKNIDQIVGGGGSFHFLLFSLGVMEGPLPKLVAK